MQNVVDNLGHLDAAKRALQRLPPPQSRTITDALVNVYVVTKAFSWSLCDVRAAQTIVTNTLDDLARFAVSNASNASEGVTADVHEAIEQLRNVAVKLHTARAAENKHIKEAALGRTPVKAA